MANALNREIAKGDRVVVRAKLLKPEYRQLENRVFICEDGFGMQPFTTGKMIYGKWQMDGEPGTIQGGWISVEETQQLQEQTPDENLPDKHS